MAEKMNLDEALRAEAVDALAEGDALDGLRDRARAAGIHWESHGALGWRATVGGQGGADFFDRPTEAAALARALRELASPLDMPRIFSALRGVAEGLR